MCTLGCLTDGIQVKTKCFHQTEMLSSWILQHLTRIGLYSVEGSSKQCQVGILDLGELWFSLLETAISGHKRVISTLLGHLNLRYMTVPLSTGVWSHYLTSRLSTARSFVQKWVSWTQQQNKAAITLRFYSSLAAGMKFFSDFLANLLQST